MTAEATLGEMALAQIIGLFRTGELRPGDIVNEADLAKRFAMSRGPVREAVRTLEGRKLVEREAFQRARVVTLTLAHIKQIFELRECLEGMACRLATRRMTDAQLRAFARQLRRNADSDGDSDAARFTADFRFNFHMVIVEGCGNPRIQSVLSAEVYDLVRLYRWSTGAVPGRDGAAHGEHVAICAAMLARNEDLSESLMRAHVQRSMQLLAP